MKNKFKPQRFRIFQNDNQIVLSVEKDRFYIDIEQLLPTINNFTKEEKKSLNDYDISIVFMGIELTGGTESPNPLFQYFFGELDKDNTIKQDTPSYYFSPKDEENNLGTLLIFLNASTLTLLNYSLIDSSLNIKLELTNKESKEKQDKATMQREQKQHKEQLKPLSIAMLHPILEDNEMKCIHGGVVQLKSNLGKEALKNFKYNQSITHYHWSIENTA